MKNYHTSNMERQPILEKLDSIVKATEKFESLVAAAKEKEIISSLETDIILKRFRSREEQLSAFYLLLNSKNCTPQQIISLLNASGNGAVAKVYQPDERSGNDNRTEKEVWQDLQKLISNNIDRLSSHTMNLGLVLCFASGAELITGKDREIIANSSTLEIDQLKKFYVTVSRKEEDAYGKLLKVLKMTHNNWALDVLEIKE